MLSRSVTSVRMIVSKRFVTKRTPDYKVGIILMNRKKVLGNSILFPALKIAEIAGKHRYRVIGLSNKIITFIFVNRCMRFAHCYLASCCSPSPKKCLAMLSWLS